MVEKGEEHESVLIRSKDKPIRPNMLVINADGQSSTFPGLNLSHSVFSQTALFNTRLHASNFEGAAFDACDFDGAVLTGCSLRGVELVNCDVDHLTINGVNIGHVLKLMMGEVGGVK